MSRRRSQSKRQVLEDPVYGTKTITKIINSLMIGGKKTVAEKIIYRTFDLIKEKSKQDPMKVFNEALKNVNQILKLNQEELVVQLIRCQLK